MTRGARRVRRAPSSRLSELAALGFAVGLLALAPASAAAPGPDTPATSPATSSDRRSEPGPAVRVSLERDGERTLVKVKARGLEPGQRVWLGSGPPDSEYELVTSKLSAPDGSVAFEVPVLLPPREELPWVMVVADDQGRTLAVSEPFVLGPEEARPPSLVSVQPTDEPLAG